MLCMRVRLKNTLTSTELNRQIALPKTSYNRNNSPALQLPPDVPNADELQGMEHSVQRYLVRPVVSQASSVGSKKLYCETFLRNHYRSLVSGYWHNYGDPQFGPRIPSRH